jgi:integrase
VERFASTEAAARNALIQACRDWEKKVEASPPADGLSPTTKLGDAGELWLAEVKRSPNLSVSTVSQYEATWKRFLKDSAPADLTLAESNRVPVLRAYLQAVADERGTAAAKSAKSILSSILRFAIEDGALEFNAMRDVRSVRGATSTPGKRDTSRALTRDERQHLLQVADTDERAQALDVVDVVWFMAATGCRINEALGQRWEDVDLANGKVLIRGTKTAASTRLITMPMWLTGRLTERAASIGTSGLLFPSPGRLDSTKPRDTRNVARVFRRLLDEAGFPWATPHTLRRTVASLIDQAGLSVALAADVLGHADASMTARVYLGRRGDTSAAAAVL